MYYYQYLASIPGGALLGQDYKFRNQQMYHFLMDLAEGQNANRLLVIVGAGHKLFLEELLKKDGHQVISTEALLQGIIPD